MMPRVSQTPAEDLSVHVSVNLRLIDIELLVLVLLVEILYLEVNLVSKKVLRDHRTLVLILPIRVHPHHHLGYLGPVRPHIRLNVRLV